MERRIDELGRLGTSVITISGGEPLLHPDLDRVIARIRKTGAIAGMITNGYLLMPDRIERLNRAGLDHMQISIDNVMPDDVSKKSSQGPRRQAQNARRTRRLPRQHQLRRRRRHATRKTPTRSPPARWSSASPPPSASSTTAPASSNPLGEAERTVWDQRPQAHPPQLLPLQPLPGSHRQRPAQRLALPRRQPATSTSASSASSTTARSSAATPASPSPTTSAPTSSASSSRKNPAPPTAPSPASTRSATSTTGAPRRRRRSPHPPQNTRPRSSSRFSSGHVF